MVNRRVDYPCSGGTKGPLGKDFNVFNQPPRVHQGLEKLDSPYVRFETAPVF